MTTPNHPPSYLLRNGLIIDGRGNPGFVGDVLIRPPFIQKVAPAGSEIDLTDCIVIDCTDKVIAPGFIDVHSHMDYFAVKDQPESFSPFINQGITTLVTGNCGFSPFGFEGNSPSHDLIENSLFKAGHDHIHWDTFEGYQQHIKQHGLRHNVLSLAGHGTCRTSLSGFSADKLNPADHQKMLALLDESLAQGAAGVSLGLQYKPGIFAPAEELRDIALLVKKWGRILTVHAKAYSILSGTYPIKPFGQPHNLIAIKEMLDLARETGVKLQFSHLIFVGKKTWPTMRQALDMFDQAIADGVDVKFDIFPYPCGATLLNTLLPEWVMAGMPDILHKTLPMLRLRVEAALSLKAVGLGYENIQITAACCSEYDKFNGQVISDIARQVNKSSFNVLAEILEKSNAEARMLFHEYYDPTTFAELMKHPASLLMTDAWPEPSGIQNPATYGSFPKFLQLARDTQCLSLEAVVSKMTGTAAERFGLTNRGLLQEGLHADITVFDWNSVQDNATPDNTSAAPSGIEHVFINGIANRLNGQTIHEIVSGEFLKPQNEKNRPQTILSERALQPQSHH